MVYVTEIKLDGDASGAIRFSLPTVVAPPYRTRSQKLLPWFAYSSIHIAAIGHSSFVDIIK
jgi:hypothetical protein